MSHFVVPFRKTNKSHINFFTFIVYFIRRPTVAPFFNLLTRSGLYFIFFADFPMKKMRKKKCFRVFTCFGRSIVFAFVCLRTAGSSRRKASPKWRHRMKKRDVVPRLLWMHGNLLNCEVWTMAAQYGWPSSTCLASTMMTMMMDMMCNNGLYEEVRATAEGGGSQYHSYTSNSLGNFELISVRAPFNVAAWTRWFGIN